MKTKFIIVLFMLFFSCKSYVPFNNKNEKNKALNEIIDNYNLSAKEKEKIKNKDSVLYLISNYKKNVSSKTLTKKRLDSFFYGTYNKKELWLLLALDRDFPNKKPFEKNYNNESSGLQTSNYNEAVKLIKNMDSVINATLQIKKLDSLKN